MLNRFEAANTTHGGLTPELECRRTKATQLLRSAQLPGRLVR